MIVKDIDKGHKKGFNKVYLINGEKDMQKFAEVIKRHHKIISEHLFLKGSSCTRKVVITG
ncbi:hypothetical protein OSO01_41570 [Oceanobacillus sojae]|uniref:Uncharacterized protein n=1 Tax=Oceanobacillus sojae TaxID=582851 RepID=A0A511ZPQ5_9BACI|nr:hypothetical protein OSO01_41570 [Oceanobacillus sojae]